MAQIMKETGSRRPRAGGSLLAIAILLGTLIGAILGQVSIGFLAGTGLGVILLGLIWLGERR
jgi:mannose/fructose/N-acetylgalactosamine-specific phosphotransferase system component IIC